MTLLAVLVASRYSVQLKLYRENEPFESQSNGFFVFSLMHTHTRRNRCNFSMMIIITRVMRTSRGQAFVSLLSTEYVTVKPDSELIR